jgi:hypothetical protein
LTAAESSAQTCLTAIQAIVQTLQQNSDRARQILAETRQQKDASDKRAAVASTEPIGTACLLCILFQYYFLSTFLARLASVYVVPDHIDLGRPNDVSSNRGATFHSSRDCAILALRTFCGRNNLPVDAVPLTCPHIVFVRF